MTTPAMILRTTCRGCNGTRLEQVLDLGMMPLAGGFLADEAAIATETSFPLTALICHDCALVQIPQIINPEILFQDYSFSSSTIAPLVQHFEGYAKWLVEKLKPSSVVEFGCNDGILLTPLEKLGVKTAGVDISKNIAQMAREKGLDVTAGYFNEETAKALQSRLGSVDIVTGSNAFAHNDQPEKILAAARAVLKPTGHFCLEVMYAGDCLETFQWDTLYHEHLTFYSLTSLSRLLKKNGFTVVEAERIPMHGGSLRIAASLNPDEPPRPSVAAHLDYENAKGVASPETWLAFGRHIRRKIDIVKDTLGRLSKSSRIWGYGAAGKATLWVNACGMNYLEGMVDGSPLRAGKLMPGTHTPIVFPDELKKNPPDYIFVTAWNYAEHIRAKETWFKGAWITPLPDLRFF